ncbi:hypothetical protein H9Q13_12340 [Pontibacter sp. JH31]|uniref:Lipoprotein n=1 Tax=Pontibacter aquaedesilientis TaxID=2766980 RepID=A0ABR7XI30_9BACT|nr:hypothetical protein [Pontibacter aquaedesilientis]MBD1397957.1 hypothetical protein [Pontibacter aquaedesilientis]
MRKYINWIGALTLLGTVGCTSLSEGGTGNLPPDPRHSQRVRYSEGNPVRQLMYEQSSEVNRKRRIEENYQNVPVNLPPEVRPHQLPNAPVDTTRHRILRPLPTRPPVGNN